MTISKDAEIRQLRAALQRARNYVAAAAEFEPSDDEPPSGPEVLAAIDAALADSTAPKLAVNEKLVEQIMDEIRDPEGAANKEEARSWAFAAHSPEIMAALQRVAAEVRRG